MVLTAAIGGWVTDIGIHQFHEMTISAMIRLVLVLPLGLLLYHPTARGNTGLAPVILTVPHAVHAFLSGSPLLMPFATMSGLAILILVLHPAGRSHLRFERFESFDWLLVVLYEAGVLPVLGYAALEATKQLGPVDKHLVSVHFGGMAVGGLFIALMGGLAVVRQRDGRFVAWSTGLVGAFVGLSSLEYPARTSSLGSAGAR